MTLKIKKDTALFYSQKDELNGKRYLQNSIIFICAIKGLPILKSLCTPNHILHFKAIRRVGLVSKASTKKALVKREILVFTQNKLETPVSGQHFL